MNLIFFLKQIFNQIPGANHSSILNIKYYRRWAKSLSPNHNSIKDHLPWINFPAIDFLDKSLTKKDKVFEFGGGGSTLYFLDRVKEVVTVEHDKKWFDTLKGNMTISNDKKWNGNLVLPEISNTIQNCKGQDPDHYCSEDLKFKNMNFRKYASYIEKFPEEYFDVILVDGRARPSCIKHSFNKVKKGGLLILDNAEREYYLKNISHILQNFKLALSSYAPLPYIKTFTQTNIWIRT